MSTDDSVARALKIETQGLKNVIFDFLKSHQFDVRIQSIGNSQMTKISLLCQFAAISTRIFGQNSQLLQCKMGLTSLHDSISSPVYVTRKSREICVRTLAFSCLLTLKAFGTTSTTFTVLAKNFPLNLT